MVDTQSPAEVQEEIVEEFQLFDDWADRYRYLIELGRKLPAMPEALKTEANKVKGCQSQVWLDARFQEGRVDLQADSDAMIVRGLVALLVRLYSGRTPEEILATDPDFIDQIEMGEHLSMNRSNGLRAMVKQIKLYAVAFQAIQG